MKKSRRENQSPADKYIVELIQERQDIFTPGERKVANTLIAGYPMVGLQSSAAFAKRAGVSHPSVLRFISKLGFSGYPDFQAALRFELEARLKSPLTKDKFLHQELGDNANDAGAVSYFGEIVCRNVRGSMTRLPPEGVEAVVALLADHERRLFVTGGGQLDAIAQYASRRLHVLRPLVTQVTWPSSQWSEFLLDMDSRGVLLVFDARRYQVELHKLARQAHERAATVILITDQWLSPIAAVADHVLPVRIDAPSPWDSYAAIVAVVEGVIARIGDIYWRTLRNRLEDLEQFRGDYEE